MSHMVRVNTEPVRGFTVMGVEDGIYPCGVSALGIGWEGSEPGPWNGYEYELIPVELGYKAVRCGGGVRRRLVEEVPPAQRLDSYGEGGR